METTYPRPTPHVFSDVTRCVSTVTTGERVTHTEPHTHVLVTCQDTGEAPQRLWDSYAQHSLAPRLRLPAGAPGNLQVSPDPHDNQRRRCITRKVLRKHGGRSLVCDESVCSPDSDVDSFLDERLADLHLSPSPRPDLETDSEDSSVGGISDTDGISLSAFESYVRGLVGNVVRQEEVDSVLTSGNNRLYCGFSAQTRSQSDGDVRPKAKSFIRPLVNPQTVKKTDPVAKYLQYKQLWDMLKLPGESDRRAARLEIKERISYQPPPPRPRRVFVPNTYVVPTEKKRSALRWEIRSDLAHGLRPHTLGSR